MTINNGVALKTVSRMLSHSSVLITEKYVQPNKRNISDFMNLLQEKLFDERGKLKKLSIKPVAVAETTIPPKEETDG